MSSLKWAAAGDRARLGLRSAGTAVLCGTAFLSLSIDAKSRPVQSGSVKAAGSPANTAGPSAPGVTNRRLPRPECAAVMGAFDPAVPRRPQVDVLRAHRIACAPARRVVARCVSQWRVRGWRPSNAMFTSSLSSHRRVITVQRSAGPVPRCLRGPGLRAAQQQPGEFGPFEYPVAYPADYPTSVRMTYEWPSPTTSTSASVPPAAVASVLLKGAGHNPDDQMRAFWFEYGRTRDLGSSTERQNPPASQGDELARNSPVPFNAMLRHLRAKTRYFWQSVASFDERQPDGGKKVVTVRGALGSFVTNPYPTIQHPSRPCLANPAETFEVTESLMIVCSGVQRFTVGACFPFCVNFYHGPRLNCDKDFPRNLNAGTITYTVPKIGLPIDVNELASYWRTNDSNRFIRGFGQNPNSPGGQVGPVPGWSEWDVAQYGIPFVGTTTDAEFWINCTDQWGDVTGLDALAAGEGTDAPNPASPPPPREVAAVRTADGAIDVTWQEPASTSPATTGYYVALRGWPPGAPQVFGGDEWTPIYFTGLHGRLSAGAVRTALKAIPQTWSLAVAVAAVSREGVRSEPALVPWAR